MEASLQNAIRDVITEAMKRVVVRVIEEDPFDEKNHKLQKPLYAALVPQDMFKGSHFERRFVTIFGRVWESLVCTIGAAHWGWANTQHKLSGQIRQGCLARIQKTLDDLEHNRQARGERPKPNWAKELHFVRAGEGPWQDVTVNCDVFVSTSPNTPGCAFELKAPQPNSDQTKVSKEKLLKLHCMEPCQVTATYFALPYNPYGERHLYDWRFPKRWFDMQRDDCVLIGEDLWNLVGGEGTYGEIIRIAEEVGLSYRSSILDHVGIGHRR